MFTVGMGRPMDLFFIITSMLIAIPTGVKVLNWSATMVGGRIRFDVPMLFCIAFLIQFLVAGLTGISHASAALDWQTKNSYYLVPFSLCLRRRHRVRDARCAAILVSKMSGRMMSESLGRWTFWLWVIGST
jgi:heme/copper-type cytochrome/quinol oxidase subunit 1